MKLSDITPSFLKDTRKNLDMTTGDIAKEIGCSERFIAYRESGARPIKKLFAYAIIGFIKTRK